MSHLQPTLSHGQGHTGASTQPARTHTHEYIHAHTHTHTEEFKKASICIWKATGDTGGDGVTQRSPAASFNVPLSSTAQSFSRLYQKGIVAPGSQSIDLKVTDSPPCKRHFLSELFWIELRLSVSLPRRVCLIFPPMEDSQKKKKKRC